MTEDQERTKEKALLEGFIARNGGLEGAIKEADRLASLSDNDIEGEAWRSIAKDLKERRTAA